MSIDFWDFRAGTLGMTVSHPSRAGLEQFFLGGGVAAEDDAIARHLLPECAVCSEVIGSCWIPESPREECEIRGELVPTSDEKPYDEVVGRVLGRVKGLEAAVEAERREASRLLPRLLRQPLERQLILVCNSRQYQTGALCDLLLETAFERRYDDPRSLAALAHVAVAAASRLDRAKYGDPLVSDFQGRCWAHLANAHRILGDLAAADQGLRTAKSLLGKGTGNPLDEALYWYFRTSLHSTREEHREAIRSAARAVGLYRGIGERHLVGRTLIQQGMVWGYADDMVREVVLVRTGLELLEPEREPRVALAGWHNLCWALHQTGHHRQALSALARARPAYVALGDRANLLRFQYLEGMIASALRRDEQAEGCLRQAREGFVQLGIVYEAAFVSLELAALFCRLGRTAEVRELAAEMIAVFESRQSGQATIAAFILLRRAAERDRLTEALIRRIGGSLDRARSQG